MVITHDPRKVEAVARAMVDANWMFEPDAISAASVALDAAEKWERENRHPKTPFADNSVPELRTRTRPEREADLPKPRIPDIIA